MTAADWRALEHAIAGQLLLPTSAGYDEARKTANARYDDVLPAAIVRCATPEDVRETISVTRHSGLALVPRSGGHSMDGRSSTDGVVIDVTPMRSVTVTGDSVTVGSGARLGDLYASLADHGLMVPAGSCPSVGIAGLTLGGGLGFVGRRYGLTSDHLLAATVVLADGRIVEVDRDHYDDLFWALRGGGMLTVGVVTSFVFAPRAAAGTTNFRATWSFDRAVHVIGAWQDWAPAAPDELSASLTVAAYGGVDAPVVEVFGAMLGTEAETAQLLDQLVARVGEPTWSFVEAMPHRAAVQHWAALGDRFRSSSGNGGSRPSPFSLTKSEFFRQPIPTDGIAALVEHFAAGAAVSRERELAFIPWGGAYNRMGAEETAFPFRQDRFTLKHAIAVDLADASLAEPAAGSWVTRSWELAHRWASGGVFPNFGDPDLVNPAAAYYGANFSRLSEVKARYDPDGTLGTPIDQAGGRAP